MSVLQSTADPLAGPSDLELVNYGAGYAWLRPEVPRPDRRYALTQSGRDLLARWRAEEFLFGRRITCVEAKPLACAYDCAASR